MRAYSIELQVISILLSSRLSRSFLTKNGDSTLHQAAAKLSTSSWSTVGMSCWSGENDHFFNEMGPGRITPLYRKYSRSHFLPPSSYTVLTIWCSLHLHVLSEDSSRQLTATPMATLSPRLYRISSEVEVWYLEYQPRRSRGWYSRYQTDHQRQYPT